MDFFSVHISKKAQQLVQETLESTFISEGKRVKEFENSLEQLLGLSRPVAVNSGTSALHLGLVVANVKDGDEVILPPQTFVATGIVILQQRAKPVFADIQYKTGNIDPDSIRSKITEKTKAIIPVHWGGYPCDMDEINEIAKEHNLVVIEDAAHALGARYHGKPIGAVSRFTAFSFQAIKHLTTGDGGALCCLFEEDFKAARNLRWFGIDREKSKPTILGERKYNIETAGFKYHMSDIAAAIGLGNLENFAQRLKLRKAIARRYREELSGISGLQLLEYQEDRESSFWLFTVLVEKRENFIKVLQAKGIPTSVVHQRIDRNSIFGDVRHELTNQEKFDNKQISLPLHPDLTEEDVEQVIKTIKGGW